MGGLSAATLVAAGASPGTIEVPVEVELESPLKDGGWIVTVYDNDVNTFAQVIYILMRATGCSMEEAEMETWEIHHLGRSVVHHGGAEACRKAAEVIATIGIRVEATHES